MKKTSKSFLILLPFLLGACSNPFGGQASYVQQSYGPVEKANPAATGYEPVSGSTLSQTTNHHIVDTTVGTATSEIKLTTTKNKLVYLNVQGQIISK